MGFETALRNGSRVTCGDKIKENDYKRRRFDCIYYISGKCVFSGTRKRTEHVKYDRCGRIVCTGASHCLRYKDKENNIKKIKESKSMRRIVKVIENNQAKYVKYISEFGIEYTMNYKEALIVDNSKAASIKKKIKTGKVIAMFVNIS